MMEPQARQVLPAEQDQREQQGVRDLRVVLDQQVLQDQRVQQDLPAPGLRLARTLRFNGTTTVISQASLLM